MLNLLSIYAGYDSWYEFKKQHLFAGELLQENEDLEEEEISELEKTVSSVPDLPRTEIRPGKVEIQPVENTDLQKTITENQTVKVNQNIQRDVEILATPSRKNFFKKNAWALVTSVLIAITGILGFKDVLFQKPTNIVL